MPFKTLRKQSESAKDKSIAERSLTTDNKQQVQQQCRGKKQTNISFPK